jgi:hypothetical protein
VKHLSGTPLKGRLLASPTNIRLGQRQMLKLITKICKLRP